MERKLLDMTNQLFISEYNASVEYGDQFQFIATSTAGFGAGTPQQEHFKNAGALQKCSPGRAQHFQELKICGHGTILVQNMPFRECVTWTTDGFFRETQDMVRYRRAEGCTTVEMECAALAACARKRGASFGQILYTADSLANVLKHNERDWGKNSLRKALELCIAVLQTI